MSQTSSKFFFQNISGYSLSSSDLISLPSKNAAELQEMAAKSSIKGLAERMSGTEDLTSLLYGPNSLGALLENEQLTIDGVAEDITAIPSPTNRSPRSSNDKDYFGATESPSVKNHLDRVDAAIQVEIEGDYRYHGANKNKTLTELYQKEFSRAFGNALIKFFVTYFGEH